MNFIALIYERVSDKLAKQMNKKKRIAVVAVVAVFVICMSAWIGTLISQNISLEKELEEKQNVLSAMQEENTALEALVDEENETALMEKYARKAGYVYPAERVYINGN